MSFSRIYLDSNILIAAFGGEADPKVSGPILDLIGSVGIVSIQPFVTSELTLAESLVRAMRSGNERREQILDNVLVTSGWLYVSPVSRGILWAAANLRAQYSSLKLPDAIHIATALSDGCSHLLTEDRQIKESYQLAATRNGETVLGSSKTTIVRADPSTLEEITIWLAS